MTSTERIRLQAYEEGHALGFKEGFDEGLKLGHADGERKAYDAVGSAGFAEVNRFADELNVVSESVMDAVAAWYEQAEESLASLAVVIAERIVRSELRTSPDAILNITREALLEVTHAATARIRVNPFESETLREHKEQLMSIAPSLKSVEIIDDSSIQGGCVIETDGGLVDAAITTKLTAIVEAARRAS